MTVFTCNFWCFFRVPRGSWKSRQKSSQDLQKVPVEDFPGQFWGRLWFLGCPVWSQKRPGITKIMLKMTTENRFVLGGAPGCHFGCIFHDFWCHYGRSGVSFWMHLLWFVMPFWTGSRVLFWKHFSWFWTSFWTDFGTYRMFFLTLPGSHSRCFFHECWYRFD